MSNTDLIILIFSVIFVFYVYFRGIDSFNLVIVTVYMICVIYVFYRAKESVEDMIAVKFEQDKLNAQAADQNLQDLLSCNFKLKDNYEIDQFKELEIIIENKSEFHNIQVEWDNSSLTNYDGRSRRVIRLTPNMTRDLAQRQVNSIIAPNKTLKEQLTAEDVLKAEADGTLKVASPLVSLTKLKTGSPGERRLYNGFMKQRETLNFNLQLVLRLFDITVTENAERLHTVNCPFTVSKLSWTTALPWNQKRKDF